MNIDEMIKPLVKLLMKNWRENSDQDERDLLMEIYNQIIPESQRVYNPILPYFEDVDYSDDEDWDGLDECEPFESHDLSDDADALASAGWGTDEDYGCYGE
jgi:hypothetical protein